MSVLGIVGVLERVSICVWLRVVRQVSLSFDGFDSAA